MKLLRKYLLIFAILGLAVLAFSAMSHNVSATDQHITENGWEFHYDSTNSNIITKIVDVGGGNILIIPDDLNFTTIGNHGLAITTGSSYFISITLSNKITVLDTNAFWAQTILSNIVLDESLKTINDYVFSNCPNLYRITFYQNITHIGVNQFDYTPINDIDFIGKYVISGINANWLTGSVASIKGHAYNSSGYPSPGQLFNGLLMGSNIPEPIVPVTGTVSGTSWYVLVIALAIVGLMTYAGMRDHNFMLLSGICWSSVSYIVIIPLSMPLAMIGVVIGLLLCIWGV